MYIVYNTTHKLPVQIRIFIDQSNPKNILFWNKELKMQYVVIIKFKNDRDKKK